MSRNRIILISFLLLALVSDKLNANKHILETEDTLMMKGILYEEYKKYENSYQIYKTLFDKTGIEIYLFKEAASSILGNIHISESIARLKYWDAKYPEKIEVKRLLIPLYLSQKDIKNAKREAEFLLEHSQSPLDLDLVSNSFLYVGEFKRALALLMKVYEIQPTEETLLRISEIMDAFTDERKKAIQLLETYRRMHVASQKIYKYLLYLYQKEKNLDGLLETYKALYSQDPQEVYMNKIIDIYVYQQDMDGAIAFLEAHPYKKELLFELYKVKRYFAKAIKLTDVLYEESRKSKWIAEKGVLMFENAKDKNDKQMIHKVIKQFEKAIALGNDDSIYLNYYGYTLIDKEIDVAKGMQIIKDALVQQPDNSYYLDSLAWGYYKEGQCDKAYDYMKKVVTQEGLKEKEIRNHWNVIRACKKRASAL